MKVAEITDVEPTNHIAAEIASILNQLPPEYTGGGPIDEHLLCRTLPYGQSIDVSAPFHGSITDDGDAVLDARVQACFDKLLALPPFIIHHVQEWMVTSACNFLVPGTKKSRLSVRQLRIVSHLIQVLFVESEWR